MCGVFFLILGQAAEVKSKAPATAPKWTAAGKPIPVREEAKLAVEKAAERKLELPAHQFTIFLTCLYLFCNQTVVVNFLR